MSKFQDLTGQKFGRLTVVERVKNSKWGHARWRCVCDCGNEIIAVASSLKSGNTNSCGCYQKDKAREAKTTHGFGYTRLYVSWFNMKARCSNPKNEHYKYYGGRGITYCKEWEQFEPFRDWAMNNGYVDNLTLDRIDFNGNYEPSNCRWATQKEQANNMSTNRLLTYNGETHNTMQWAEIMNINYHTLRNRILKLGWSIEKALTYKNEKEIINGR